MSTVNIENIREEICNYLRNSDILTITLRGVTTTTDTFTATAGQTVFTVTHLNLRNIRSLTVNSVSKSYLRDYTVNWITGVITLNTGASVSDPVAINYDYGTTGDKIYPDLPRDDLTLGSFPRIGIQITGSRTQPLSLGGMDHLSDFLITVFCWIPVNKDSTVSNALYGTKDLSTLLASIRDKIRSNAKNFVSFQYIYPMGLTPITKSTNNKIMQQGQELIIKFLVE